MGRLYYRVGRPGNMTHKSKHTLQALDYIYEYTTKSKYRYILSKFSFANLLADTRFKFLTVRLKYLVLVREGSFNI